MFVIVDLKIIFRTEFVGMFVTYLYTKFHIPNSSGLLVTIIKLKAKYRFHTAVNLLLYILPREVNGSRIFFEDLLPYIPLCGSCSKLKSTNWGTASVPNFLKVSQLVHKLKGNHPCTCTQQHDLIGVAFYFGKRNRLKLHIIYFKYVL
jgi:hypothetical protein